MERQIGGGEMQFKIIVNYIFGGTYCGTVTSESSSQLSQDLGRDPNIKSVKIVEVKN